MNLNVVDLILADHREIEHLFDQVRAQPDGRAALVPLIVNMLTAHSRAEEATAYPAAAKAGIEAVQHSQREHLEADQLAAAVAAADPDAADFEDKVEKLIEAVLHHVREEETDVLPKMRDAMAEDDLVQIGRDFLAVREQHLGAMPADITADEMRRQAGNAGIGVGDRNKDQLAHVLKDAAEE